MRPAQAIGTGLAESFQFSGRASRSECWWFLPIGAVLPILALSSALILAPDLPFPGLCGIFFIAVLPLLAVARRRPLDGGSAPTRFETPLVALMRCLGAGWAIGALDGWARAEWQAAADGPAGVAVFAGYLAGNAILIPVFAHQLVVGFVTGISLFLKMTSPAKPLSDKPRSIFTEITP